MEKFNTVGDAAAWLRDFSTWRQAQGRVFEALADAAAARPGGDSELVKDHGLTVEEVALLWGHALEGAGMPDERALAFHTLGEIEKRELLDDACELLGLTREDLRSDIGV